MKTFRISAGDHGKKGKIRAENLAGNANKRGEKAEKSICLSRFRKLVRRSNYDSQHDI